MHFLRISLFSLLISAFLVPAADRTAVITSLAVIEVIKPLEIEFDSSGSRYKKVFLTLSLDKAGAGYATLSLFYNDELILDNIDIPFPGTHELNALTVLSGPGKGKLRMEARGSDLTVTSLEMMDMPQVVYPSFREVTAEARLTSVPSTKYGGPCIADMDMDGYPDIMFNEHNMADSYLFWNNRRGKFIRHEPKLTQWFKQDLHGYAAGDYDNDGDLDLLMARGGGNGTTPNPPVFYINEGGSFRSDHKGPGLVYGARGRAARWLDADQDGDLDLILLNADGKNHGDNKHIFYENDGEGNMTFREIPGLGNVRGGDRCVVTDFNNDGIDDLLLFPFMSLWQGNGDFTFTDVSHMLPADCTNMYFIRTAAELDMDNDGDMDIYLAGGKGYFEVAKKGLDFDPRTGRVDIKDTAWAHDKDPEELLMDFEAGESVTITDFEFSAIRHLYTGDFPIFLGADGEGRPRETLTNIKKEAALTISRDRARDWPEYRLDNGLYISYLSGDQWRLEAVKCSNLSWGVAWVMEGVKNMSLDGEPNNRNIQDVLLRNDGDKFTDVSAEWNIPIGGNHWGVTAGDFNNDSFTDLFIYRYGFMRFRINDYLLLNDQGKNFEISTVHRATAVGESCHGDMGQAFDYDLDGAVDILSGDDEYGTWHLFKNSAVPGYNFCIVRVGYSPEAYIDPISASVVLKTPDHVYRKRVGSAGENHSQSLINNVHFGLGTEEQVMEIVVRWRNGETLTIKDPRINRLHKAR